MIDQTHSQNQRQSYRSEVSQKGKKEFTLLKMQEYGFWPKNLPTPYEKQKAETKEDYEKRKALLKEYDKLSNDLANLYGEKEAINLKLQELKKKYTATWDYEKIRQDIAKTIMAESIARRAERKKEREVAQAEKSAAWQKAKTENIVFIGKGYSSGLQDKLTHTSKLESLGLPLIETDHQLASFLGLTYTELRFLTYHRDVVTSDHYYRYEIPKKKGGFRQIAAPKPLLKQVQRKILVEILEKLPIAEEAHGFIKNRSVVSSAEAHIKAPTLLITMDLENFFPTLTFERVRGMYKSFGYSGYIASLLAMLCTYCERMTIEVSGTTKYVKTSPRILPQGSPASPMITNIICKNLDHRLKGLSATYQLTYSRYADDMSFSYNKAEENLKLGQFLGLVSLIVEDEGFHIKPSKTKMLRPHNRQCLTGIVINNEEIGVPKKWVKNLRAAIHHAKLLNQTGQPIPTSLSQEIQGKTSWLKSVNHERYKTIIEAGLSVIAHF